MNSTDVNILSLQGHRLLQMGVALLMFSSLEGFAIPYFSAPRLGLSAHTLSALEAGRRAKTTLGHIQRALAPLAPRGVDSSSSLIRWERELCEIRLLSSEIRGRPRLSVVETFHNSAPLQETALEF